MSALYFFKKPTVRAVQFSIISHPKLKVPVHAENSYNQVTSSEILQHSSQANSSAS